MASTRKLAALLSDPVAEKLLSSAIPARLAYTWLDGTPRVVPIWFHWNGESIVLGTPDNAPKMELFAKNPEVALTIDSNEFPYTVLLIRGKAEMEMTEDATTPEYRASAARYLGEAGGKALVDMVTGKANETGQKMARIIVRPTWVKIMDFETRFPKALS